MPARVTPWRLSLHAQDCELDYGFLTGMCVRVNGLQRAVLLWDVEHFWNRGSGCQIWTTRCGLWGLDTRPAFRPVLWFIFHEGVSKSLHRLLSPRESHNSYLPLPCHAFKWPSLNQWAKRGCLSIVSQCWEEQLLYPVIRIRYTARLIKCWHTVYVFIG